jgi:hypothetical protein
LVLAGNLNPRLSSSNFINNSILPLQLYGNKGIFFNQEDAFYSILNACCLRLNDFGSEGNKGEEN